MVKRPEQNEKLFIDRKNGEEKKVRWKTKERSFKTCINQQINCMSMWNLVTMKNYKLNRIPNNAFHMRATHQQNNAQPIVVISLSLSILSLIKYFGFVFFSLGLSFRTNFSLDRIYTSRACSVRLVFFLVYAHLLAYVMN